MEKFSQAVQEAETSSIIPTSPGQKMSTAEKRAKQQYIEQWVVSTQKYMGVYSSGSSRVRRKPAPAPEEPTPGQSSQEKSTVTTVRKSASTPEGTREQHNSEGTATTGAASDSAVKSMLKRLHGLKAS